MLQPEPGFQFEGIAEKLIRKFEAEGYGISTRIRGGINASCLLRFPALLHHDQASLLAGTQPEPAQKRFGTVELVERRE
jgi:hypothetical protein